MANFIKYNFETDGIFYCPNNVIIDKGEVIKYDKKEYLLIDNFVINFKERTINLYDKKAEDSFADDLKDIKKIEVLKQDDNKIIKLYLNGGSPIIIQIDKLNRIIGLVNNNLQIAGDNYLEEARFIKKIEMQSLIQTGDGFLSVNMDLEQATFPNLKITGNWFMCGFLKKLKTINLPKLKFGGDCFIRFGECLKSISIPNVEKFGNYCLSANDLEELNTPKLIETGEDFLRENKKLQTINAPNFIKYGSDFLSYHPQREQLIAGINQGREENDQIKHSGL